MGLGCDLKSEGWSVFACFAGVLFDDSGRFRPVSVNFEDFQGLIFRFWSLFQS